MLTRDSRLPFRDLAGPLSRMSADCDGTQWFEADLN